MKCEYCNKEIPANSAFCPECGGKQRISVSKKNICPTCGAPLEYNDLFCSECGTPCDPVPIDDPPRRFGSSMQGVGRNILADTEFLKMVIAALFIILILAFAMSFFLLYKRNQTDMVSQDLVSTAPPDVIATQPEQTEDTNKTDSVVPSDENDANDTAEPAKDDTNSDYILPQSTSRPLNSNDI